MPDRTELEVVELRKFVAGVLAEVAITDDVAGYLDRNLSSDVRQSLAIQIMEIVSTHEIDAELERALREDLGFTFKPRADRQTATEWLTQLAVALLS